MINFIIELLQSICLIVAAIIIVITAFGILRLDDDMEKVIYVRIHMLGMVDIACVLGMVGLGQYLIAGVYFVLAPFLAHAMANAYYHGEDERKYETGDELTGRIDDNVRNELLNKDITIDTKFRTNFKSQNIGNDDEIKDHENFMDIGSGESSKNDVLIKEVITDDIENSGLNKGGGEKDD